MKLLLQAKVLGIENLEIQVVVGLVLLGMWLYFMKKYPMKKDIKSMILVAMFVIIATLLSIYGSLRLPLFGVDSLRIGFAQIMLVIGGACLSPSYAFIMGIVYDVLGLVLSPTTPFLGFTLNSVLACVIPSVWYHSEHRYNMMTIVDTLLLVLLGIGLAYLQLTPEMKIGDWIVDGRLRMLMSLFLCGVIFILILSLNFILKKFGEEAALQVSQWIFIVLMIEIVIQFMSTPLWLQLLYGVPWQASLFLRVMKASVMVPINTIIGVITLRSLKKIKL